ncbi:glycosyl transferase [Mycobacterium sp. NPDC048908]|uniref:glycosyl transferase n=1 Tax=Mycobacterium sp. NPDC048908 TaxID=3364292 RepID=UPI0037216250
MSRLPRLNPSIPILGILLTLTAALRLINLTRSPVRFDDEGTYMAQAYAVAHWGELAHYTYWYDHPPAGWLQLSLWVAISGPDFGGNAIAAGRYLMVVVAVITAALLWSLARRIGMSRWAAAVAVAVFALSPLAISLTRMVYLDNLAVAWLVGALVLLCSPRYRLSAMFGAATCFGIAVLTKETMLLLLPMFAWLVWTRTAPVTRRYALAVFVAVFGVVVSTYVLMAVLRGELVPGPGHVSLWDGIRFQLRDRAAGGALDDPDSLKRHTVDQWFRLDPALPILACPVAFAALFVSRLRPFAVGLVTLIATVLRPGYLPAPFILAALPLIALLAAGTGEVAVRFLFDTVAHPSVHLRRLRIPALTAGTLIVSVVVSLWLPTQRVLLQSDDDAPMRQAQQWIQQNVPKTDRLIVDDALWLDLIRNGRDRLNVVWGYKVDTDEQVQGWAPRGWADYDWVVSTASLRDATRPNGVFAETVAHSQPVAIFGTGFTRVEVRRVDAGVTSRPSSPAALAFGGQLAAHIAGATDPDVLAVLQSRTVAQPVLATLAVIAATEPVRVAHISTIEGEDDVATPRRDITLSGQRDRLQAVAAFLQHQVGRFAVQSVDLTAEGLKVRFPVRANDIGLGAAPAPMQGGPAALRVADLRRNRSAEQVNLVRIDGTVEGSLETGADPNPSGYRSMPPGTYVVVTNPVGGGDPVIRQVVTLDPDATYTLAMFSAGDSDQVAVQLAPDGPATGPTPDAAVRMLHAASATGSVYLALLAPGMVEPMVLANQAGYGLITGYAAVPAGQYEAVLTANGHEWRQPIGLPGGEPMSLLLTDGPDGPLLQTVRDVPATPAALSSPTLTLPASGTPVDKINAKTPAIESSDGKPVAVVLCMATILAAAILTARTRRSAQENDGALDETMRALRHGGAFTRRAPVDDATRPLKAPVKPSVAPRPPLRPKDSAVHEVMRARWLGGEAIRRTPLGDSECSVPGVDTHMIAPRRRGLRQVVHRARPADDTAPLDLKTTVLKRPVAPGPRQRNDIALHQAVRARWREAVRRTRPVDDTVRLPMGVVEPSVPREPR